MSCYMTFGFTFFFWTDLIMPLYHVPTIAAPLVNAGILGAYLIFHPESLTHVNVILLF